MEWAWRGRGQAWGREGLEEIVAFRVVASYLTTAVDAGIEGNGLGALMPDE